MSSLSTLLLAAIVLIAPLHILADPSTTTELLWPLPRMSVFGSSIYSVNTDNFEFIGMGSGGENANLKGAFEHYTRLIFQTHVPFYPFGGGVFPRGVVDGVIVNVASSSEDLGPDTDESCEPIAWASLCRSGSMHVYAMSKPGIIRLSSSNLEFPVWNRNPRIVITIRICTTLVKIDTILGLQHHSFAQT